MVNYATGNILNPWSCLKKVIKKLITLSPKGKKKAKICQNGFKYQVFFTQNAKNNQKQKKATKVVEINAFIFCCFGEQIMPFIFLEIKLVDLSGLTV